MTTSVDDGSQTADVGEEHILTNTTTAGNYELSVDTDAMEIGDELILRQKKQIRATGSKKTMVEATYSHDQSSPIKTSIATGSARDIEFTLQLIKSVFTVTSMTGTVNIGDTVTGATSGATGIVENLDDLATPTRATIRVTSGGTAFQDSENAEVDGSNYLTLNDATPVRAFPWELLSV